MKLQNTFNSDAVSCPEEYPYSCGSGKLCSPTLHKPINLSLPDCDGGIVHMYRLLVKIDFVITKQLTSVIKVYVKLLMLHTFAAPVVHLGQFNAERILGNHAMAIQQQVKSSMSFN